MKESVGKTSGLQYLLLDALVDGARLSDMIDIAAASFKNPLSISSANLEILAFSKDEDIACDYWDKMNSSDMKAHYELEETTNRIGIVLDETPKIVKVDECDRRIMSCAAIWKGETLAYVLMLEYHHEFTEDDERKFAEASRIIGLLMASGDESRAARESASEHFLLKLLEGHHVSNEAIERHLFPKSDDAQYCVVTLEPLYQTESSVFPPHLSRVLDFEFSCSRSVVFRDRAVLVIRPNMSLAKFEKTIEEIAQRRNMRCGISNSFRRVSDLLSYYGQSLFALQTGRGLSGHFVNCIPYRIVAPYHMLQTANELCNIEHMCEPSLLYLRDYDRYNGTSWFCTLGTYILCQKDMKAAAAVLNIHRNTLQYRIDRIKNLLSDDIDDPSFIFRVSLSLRVMLYLSPRVILDEFGISKSLF